MSVANEKFTEHETMQGITITFQRDCKIPYDVFLDKVVSAVLLNDFVTIDEGNTNLVSFLRKVTVDVKTSIRGKVPNPDNKSNKKESHVQKRQR